MSDDTLPLAELVLPSRLRCVCLREGWHTVGELRDAVADGVVGRVPKVGPGTVALAAAVCADPEQWRSSVHEGRTARQGRLGAPRLPAFGRPPVGNVTANSKPRQP
jgi:hypothetical protein